MDTALRWIVLIPLLGAAVKGGTRAPNKSEEAIVTTMGLLLAAGETEGKRGDEFRT